MRNSDEPPRNKKGVSIHTIHARDIIRHFRLLAGGLNVHVHLSRASKGILAASTALAVVVTFSVHYSFANDADLRNLDAGEEPQVLEGAYFSLPEEPKYTVVNTVRVPVTAYSSTPDQTWGNPFITASGTRVRDGVIAANFLPLGTKVRIPEYYGNKVFVVEDRMNSRYWHRADIWMETRQEALEWGIRYTTIEVVN